MNKLLATSALVAAGLVASAGVASAQAPAPIQVVVGEVPGQRERARREGSPCRSTQG
ncbi:MAG: hypothetical protein ACO3EK_09490 [Alphaproteobacteria bacterium]